MKSNCVSCGADIKQYTMRLFHEISLRDSVDVSDVKAWYRKRASQFAASLVAS
jgi:hypothetical protein